MIRVAFLIRSLEHGGAERQLSTLIQAMHRDRFDVTVITFYPGGHFEQELVDGNIRLVSLHKRGRWEVVRFLWRLFAELKKLNPNILHSYLVEPNLIALLVKPLFPTTKIVWGIFASNLKMDSYDWFPRSTLHLQRFLSRYADLIIANSEAGRSYHVAQGFPSRKCIVIQPGVDLDRFRPDRDARRRIRSAWRIPDNTALIGLVGRLDPNKEHSIFIRAAALLVQERSDVRFVCVGGGPEELRSSLQRLADELKISHLIIWTGLRDDLPSIYNALDIACSSSSSEGFPNTIAEAMACGVTCVVTEVGDSAFLVNGTGIVVPPGDPRALAEGLSAGLTLRGSPQQLNPRERIVTNFSLSQLVDRTEAALLEESIR